MSEHNSTEQQDSGMMLRDHIVSLEQRVRNLSGQVQDLSAELAQTSTNHTNKSIECRRLTRVLAERDAQLQAATDLASERKTALEQMISVGEAQRKLRETESRTAEKRYNELRNQLAKPAGNQKFVMNMIINAALNELRCGVERALFMYSTANPRKTNRHRAAEQALREQLTLEDVPSSLQDIVKVYCVTTNTAFDIDSVLSELSAHVMLCRETIEDSDTASGMFNQMSSTIVAQRALLEQDVASEPDDILFTFMYDVINDDEKPYGDSLIDAVTKLCVRYAQQLSFELPVLSDE
ncbi:hypothetical protein YOLOSWAG_319 [Erwinia phage vB_EamM_Yoloswag]|uniref:Uncharacterized protein n=1 Tax=Erwinia phage vB_EamM_Yoloswag TaxID=1958956 RepID=A0A1S6L3N5_9CAUD|nr:hypothetical protein HOR66_gp319 [Erwinia phage vB_EamM_Yoloswag]AQT28788.1 hypothetical protein YOLOSWAG_319 [Erwinia phage vB_EamM_Yoloswag]